MASTRRRWLAAVIVLQALLLLGIVALHGARIADGTRVQLEVSPVDPTDLVRGSYVDLEYRDLDAIDAKQVDGWERGDDVYVELLEPGRRGGAWRPGDVAVEANDLDLTNGDAFIRLPTDGRGGVDTTSIDTFYADPDTARRLESDLVDGGIAEVVLSSDGDPLLDDVRG